MVLSIVDIIEFNVKTDEIFVLVGIQLEAQVRSPPCRWQRCSGGLHCEK